MRTLLLLTAILLAMSAKESTAPMQLARNRKPLVTIYLHPTATAPERYAAEELANALQKITGATFSRVEQTETPAEGILVGQSPAAKTLFPEVNLETFEAEQYVIQVKGKLLLLAGGRPRGTIYAVCRFLQDTCGVRWWTPWAETIPAKPELTIPALQINAKPAFESRDPFWYLAFNGTWAVRNGSNSAHAGITEHMGGKITYEGFVHTFFPLVPPEEHFKDHPEWYSVINGKRQYERAQLCTTNPQLRAFLVEQVKKRLRANPQANILSVSQNDWYGACECPDCKAIDDREGTHAGTMLALANYVASQIKDEFPHVAIDTLAYQYTRKAPKTIKPLPNVIVRLCSIECNFAQPLEHPSNAAFARDIRDWSKRSNRLYIWDYTTNFAHYVLPHPNWYSLGPNARFFHQNGVRGLFEQGAYQSHSSEMAELRAWVLAQLLWNPYQDDRKLIAEFLNGYYGKAAARPIQQYLDVMHEAAKNINLTCFTHPSAGFLTFATLNKAEKLWQQAEKAVQNDPEKLWRVRQGHLPVRYAFLIRWQSLRRECVQAKSVWPLPTSRKAVAEEWLKIATGPGPAGWQPMTHINESGFRPEAFVAQFKEDPPEPVFVKMSKSGQVAPPEDIAAPNKARGVEAPAEAISLVNEGNWIELRDDNTASRGVAVRMPGSHREWACQIPLSKLPEKARAGKWEVYIVARVETTASAPADALAFTAGVYDTEARAEAASIAMQVGKTAPTYRSYRVGTVTLREGQYFWAAPPASPAVQAVWIDRFFLIPAE